MKATVRKRDGYRCVECGMTNAQHKRLHGGALQVHRLEPGSPYTVDDCVTLCKPCHGPKPRSKRGQGTRVVLHMTKALRVAIQLRAIKAGVSSQQLLLSLFMDAFPDDLAEAEQYVSKPKRT